MSYLGIRRRLDKHWYICTPSHCQILKPILKTFIRSSQHIVKLTPSVDSIIFNFTSEDEVDLELSPLKHQQAETQTILQCITMTTNSKHTKCTQHKPAHQAEWGTQGIREYQREQEERIEQESVSNPYFWGDIGSSIPST